ncbi:NADP-dependent oxidoreductase [Dactylosporangium sp. CA-092794]|uniref:NADP-dependent oxidoreductase n=1 Tax=Dactylosporangium sp. CA-092794 TaxID=3239929 RepID=UPI003D8E55E5
MRALMFHEYGDPNVLKVEDVPEPHPGPGQIRIAVRAAGVSPGDAALRSGVWRDRVPLRLPYIVGLDAAGVVDEVGPGVTGVHPGDEVFGLRPVGATTAGHALLDAWAPKPAGMSWAEAGGAAGSIETAVRTLDALAVGPGTTLLLDGAAGGVGAIAVQLAVARGARVIGTASPANHEFLASLGAEPVTYGPGLAERIGGGVDAAVDVAGRGGALELVRATGHADRVVTLVDAAAERQGIRLLRFDPAGDHAAALRQGAAVVTVHVAAVFGMDEGAAAHARVEAGHARGKTVIAVA